MQKVSSAQDSHDADEDPKRIEHDVGVVALEHGAPGEYDGIRGVEEPDEHERAVRSEPTDQTEAENPHQYADHLDGFQVTQNKCVHVVCF